MRRIGVLAFVLAVIGGAAGCAKHWKNGECETSANCTDQAGYGKVCVQGRCQECGGDSDCKSGFRCRDNACVPRPECEASADCGDGKTCQDGRCVSSAPKPECDGNEECGPGKSCEAGRCVAAPEPTKTAPSLATCLSEAGSVHFAFDRANLTADAREVLSKVSTCLAVSPGSVVVEGNCDERGTVEYNLHLGQRRAEAAKKYLMSLPTRPASVSAVSYGKEHPICSEHVEACWSRNRRADFKTGP